MNRSVVALVVLLGLASSAWAAPPAKPAATPVVEDWKGPLSERDWGAGFVTGLGLIEPKYGFAVQGQVSKRIIPHGFIPDITNPVALEISAGPTWVSSNSPFVFSTHLRWDFEFNDQWILFGIGGLGGQITGPALGDRSLLHLRFGAGALYRLGSKLWLRMEGSHELIGVGAAFDL